MGRRRRFMPGVRRLNLRSVLRGGRLFAVLVRLRGSELRLPALLRRRFLRRGLCRGVCVLMRVLRCGGGAECGSDGRLGLAHGGCTPM